MPLNAFADLKGWRKSLGALAIVACLFFLLAPLLRRPRIAAVYWISSGPDAIYDWISPWIGVLFMGIFMLGAIGLLRLLGMRVRPWFGGSDLNGFAVGSIVGFGLITGTVLVLRAFGLCTISRTGESTMYGLFMSMHWVLIQCAIEEIKYRGLYLGLLRQGISPTFANLCQAFLFAAIHLPNFWADRVAIGWPLIIFQVNLFILGVALGDWAMKSGSLWGPSAAHFMWNWTMGTFFGIQVSGSNPVAPGPFRTALGSGWTAMTGGSSIGLEGGIVTMALMLLAFFVGAIMVGRRRGERSTNHVLT